MSTSLSPGKRLNQSSRTKKRNTMKVPKGIDSPSGKIAFGVRKSTGFNESGTIEEEEYGTSMEQVQAENS